MSLEGRKAGHLSCRGVKESCWEQWVAIRLGVGRLSGWEDA
jgi:hypothetical protein